MTNFTTNRVELIGFLGQDPDIRTTQSGAQVMNLSVATTESWKDKNSGEWKEKTEWHRVTVWTGGAVKAFERQNVTKGDLVRIVGKLETRKYQDKDGVDRYTTEIVVNGYNDCTVIRTKASPGDQSDTSAAPQAA
ncbi:MAG: single-stranded DNA-binding protein [Pseudomonadota bacterium]